MNLAGQSMTASGAIVGTVVGIIAAFQKSAPLGKSIMIVGTALVIGAGIGYGVSLLVGNKEEEDVNQDWK